MSVTTCELPDARDEFIQGDPDTLAQDNTEEAAFYTGPGEGTKAFAVLEFFAGGGAINARDAAQELGFHALSQCVAYLETYYGVWFTRKWKITPGYGGNPTRCVEYRLRRKERRKARLLKLTQGLEARPVLGS